VQPRVAVHNGVNFLHQPVPAGVHPLQRLLATVGLRGVDHHVRQPCVLMHQPHQCAPVLMAAPQPVHHHHKVRLLDVQRRPRPLRSDSPSPAWCNCLPIAVSWACRCSDTVMRRLDPGSYFFNRPGPQCRRLGDLLPRPLLVLVLPFRGSTRRRAKAETTNALGSFRRWPQRMRHLFRFGLPGQACGLAAICPVARRISGDHSSSELPSS